MNILIIRSTSIQHLALVIRRVSSLYPGARIDVLAHPHSVESVKQMSGVNSIITYPSASDFSPFAIGDFPRNSYPLVVVPVSNMSGAGYENVLLLALRFRKRQIVMCNKNGEVISLPLKKILERALWRFASIPLAVFAAVAIASANMILLGILQIARHGSKQN
ncbi:MAG: hypothetical protein HZA01_16910 [Nitrospinae bacterium]|nr:hypothetical protein [Nitrospinota bacterium]